MGEALSSVHTWLGSMCTRVYVCAHVQVCAGQSSAQALLGQDGCSRDGCRKGRARRGSKSPSAGRRVGAAGNANPKPLFCFEFLQRQHLYRALFVGHGENTLPWQQCTIQDREPPAIQ